MQANPFHTWYPVFTASSIKSNEIYSLKLLNEPLVVFRDKNNQISVLQDRCPHRSTPLSLGSVRNGHIECPYHGWQFDGQGHCVLIPALLPKTKIPPYAKALHKPALERHGLVWIYMGTELNPSFDSRYDEHLSWTDKDTLRFDYSSDIAIGHELMVENLLDPAHLPFAHDGTISKREKAVAISMTVSETMHGLKGEATSHYSELEKQQTFFFDAPFTVYFDLYFKQSAIRQVHYCVPLTENTMRLNSIFFYKNMTWLKWIPGINYWQQRMSKKIVAQDIAMLSGQANNLALAAKPWNQAINADKLAFSYRQWFNKVSQQHAIFFQTFHKPEQHKLSNQHELATTDTVS